jgi:signal transduction histidine kinase
MTHDMMVLISNSQEGIGDRFESIGKRHICNIYRNRNEQFSLIADFMLHGLRKGHKCIYIVDENTKDDVLGVLKEKEGRDDGSMLDNLMFLTKEDSYLKGGSFDPDRMIKLLQETQETALAEGFPELSVTGEMTWIFSKLPGVDKLLEYEAKLNYFFPNSKSTAICQYNENKFDAKTLMGVLNTHPVVGIYGELYENPYYIHPEVYLASLIGDVPVAMYENARDDCVKRASVERERRRAESALMEANKRLAESNKELDAFSYSVSHDLRAPLRSMDGFSQILLEDHADRIDEVGKDYLKRIRAASQLSGQLIDDLMKLSRISRNEMRVETVDLSELGREIAAQLRNSSPDRNVEFVIADGLVARGDPHLLKIAIDNLMGNAWKFTGRHPAARIEFGQDKTDGKKTFFVRDDGAGFDMAYVGKMFAPFQRLHSSDEFPGSGIGLATVRRIIGRHGGMIWAEGAVEKGATFYFTLDNR